MIVDIALSCSQDRAISTSFSVLGKYTPIETPLQLFSQITPHSIVKGQMQYLAYFYLTIEAR